MQIISFDIVSEPDLACGCRLYGLEGLDQHAITNAMLYKQRQQSGDQQLPLHLQRVAAASLIMVEQGKVNSLMLQDEDESSLLQALFALLDSESCRVCWQQQEVLALLQYRALHWGIPLPADWPLANGEERRMLQCGWFDLAHLLAANGNDNTLTEVAALLSLPSSLGQATGRCREIENNEQRVDLAQGALANALHIYQIYQRLAMIQGVLVADEYQQLMAGIADQLSNSNESTLRQYAQVWQDN